MTEMKVWAEITEGHVMLQFESNFKNVFVNVFDFILP